MDHVLFTRVPNPFTPDDKVGPTLFRLVQAMMDSCSFVSSAAPGIDSVVAVWALRITRDGEETLSAAVFWELSTLVNGLSKIGHAFPLVEPHESSHDCPCPEDHHAQAVSTNDFLNFSLEGDQRSAVVSIFKRVASLPLDAQSADRVATLCTMILYFGDRIGEQRSGLVMDLPSLD